MSWSSRGSSSLQRIPWCPVAVYAYRWLCIAITLNVVLDHYVFSFLVSNVSSPSLTTKGWTVDDPAITCMLSQRVTDFSDFHPSLRFRSVVLIVNIVSCSENSSTTLATFQALDFRVVHVLNKGPTISAVLFWLQHIPYIGISGLWLG